MVVAVSPVNSALLATAIAKKGEVLTVVLGIKNDFFIGVFFIDMNGYLVLLIVKQTDSYNQLV